ncbi:MAG: accessory gene regulator B family protein [Clostridia bacterium]
MCYHDVGDLMYHKSAIKLADYCVARGWIGEERYYWCVFAMEKWLLLSAFGFIVVCWMCFSGRYLETLFFLLPLYLLRRRMGGWHAQHAWTCMLISMVVIICAGYIGDALEQNNVYIMVMIDIAVILCGMSLKPAYPHQAHFTQDDAAANEKKKNHLLLGVLCFQLLTVAFGNDEILTYTLLGIALAIVSVIIEKIKIGKRFHYENTCQPRIKDSERHHRQ